MCPRGLVIGRGGGIGQVNQSTAIGRRGGIGWDVCEGLDKAKRAWKSTRQARPTGQAPAIDGEGGRGL